MDTLPETKIRDIQCKACGCHVHTDVPVEKCPRCGSTDLKDDVQEGK